jgi:hypothetical protein
VVEATGNDDEGDAGVGHLCGHEVPEPERAQPGGAAVSQEGLGHSVRFPRGGAAVVAEDERLRVGSTGTPSTSSRPRNTVPETRCSAAAGGSASTGAAAVKRESSSVALNRPEDAVARMRRSRKASRS